MADTNEQGQVTPDQQSSGQPGSSTTTVGTQGQTAPQQASGTPGSNQASTGFTYQEDRSRWIPPHRLTEESTKRQQLEARAQLLERQLQAVTNATPKDPATLKDEEIQEAFYKKFPWARKFKELNDEQIDRLLKTPEQVEQASQFVNQGWERHAKQMVGTLVQEVSDLIGGKLGDDSADDLKIAFGSYIQREVQKAEASGVISADLQKYLDGDDSLVKDFAEKFTKRWATPIRRQVVAQEVTRAKKVPNSAGRSQQTSVERPKEFKTMEDRLNFLADRAKESGVQFGQ
jgi:hypothetical protein